MDQSEAPFRKRLRLDEGEPSVYRTTLIESGCAWVVEGPHITVQDVNRLRRHLQSKLVLDGDLRDAFISGLASELEDDERLHRSLAPLEGTLSGDSLVRVLLTIAPISGAVAELLILRLAESADDLANQTTDRLIISQFRWLDSSACQEPGGISSLFMRVMDACGEELQRDILSVLPELLSETEHEDFVAKVRDLCEDNGSLLLPVLQASSMLCLAGPLQAQIMDMVLQRFDSSAAADLPAMVLYLIKHATQSNARQVAQMMRQKLRFATSVDPRSAAADPSARGKGIAGAESPSLQTLQALKAGLQVSPVSCEAFLAEIHGVDEAAQHRSLDLLVLAMLHSLGNPWRKTAVGLVKRKFGQELMDGGTIAEAFRGFQADLADLFASFLCLAGSLASATSEVVQHAGSRMYSELFLAYQDAYFRQEVLRAVHSHLGSRLPAQVSSALAALLELSGKHAALLQDYSAFLINILEYVEDFTSAQLMQVCELFSELAIAGALMTCSSNRRSQGVSGRDEFQIMLRKFIYSADLRKSCIGFAGIVCFAKCLSAAAASPDTPAMFQAQCLDSARELLDCGFSACKAAASQHRHVMYTCLCDSLAAIVALGHLHPVLLEHVRNLSLEEVQALLGDVDGEDVAPHLLHEEHHLGGATQAVQYLNLNGAENGITYPVAQLVGASDAASRDRLAYGPAMLGLCQAVELSMNQNLDSLTAVLGCSLCLLRLEGQMGLLSCLEQEAMCLSLWHAVNWLRETVNGFSADTSNMQGKDVDFQQKLILRLQHLCQLEALLKAALCHAPASLTLPTSAGNIVPFADICSERKRKAGSSDQKKSGTIGNSQDSMQTTPTEDIQPARLTEDSDGRFEKVRQHLRPLAPSALRLMLVLEDAEPRSATIAPHLLLLQELLRAVQEHLTSAASCPSSARATSELIGMVRQPMDATAGMLKACAPCLCTQLQRALDTIQEGEDEGDPPSAALLPGCDIQDTALLEQDVARDALAGTPAAAHVVQLSLQCLEHITAWDDLSVACHRPLLLSVLAALAAMAEQAQLPPSAPPDAAQQVLGHLHRAFKVVEGLLSSSGERDFDQELTVIRILHNLMSLRDKLSASSAEQTSDLQGRLSQAAGSMLQRDWSHNPFSNKKAKAKQDAQSGWKGRSAAMAALLKQYISCDTDPLKLLLTLVDLLLEPGLQDSHFAALNAASVPTWYKALFEALLDTWEDVARQLCTMGVGDAACEAQISVACKCAQAFAALIQLTKHHRDKQVHMQAIKCGGQFVEIFLTTEVFWRNLHDASDDGAQTFQQITKDVQKATRIMQILCSEAKSRKDITLIAKVPQVKRRLEQLLFMLKAVVHTSNDGGRVTVGNLKHKDLEGRVIASQECPESGEDEVEHGQDNLDDAEEADDDGSASQTAL